MQLYSKVRFLKMGALHLLDYDIIQRISQDLNFNEKLESLEAIYVDPRYKFIIDRFRLNPIEIDVGSPSLFRDYVSPNFETPNGYWGQIANLKLPTTWNWISVSKLEKLLQIPILFNINFLNGEETTMKLNKTSCVSLSCYTDKFISIV